MAFRGKEEAEGWTSRPSRTGRGRERRRERYRTFNPNERPTLCIYDTSIRGGEGVDIEKRENVFDRLILRK